VYRPGINKTSWDFRNALLFASLCCVVSSLDGRPSILAPQEGRLDEIQMCPAIFVVKEMCDFESSHEIQRTIQVGLQPQNPITTNYPLKRSTG
jgi:hypothetical protein